MLVGQNCLLVSRSRNPSKLSTSFATPIGNGMETEVGTTVQEKGTRDPTRLGRSPKSRRLIRQLRVFNRSQISPRRHEKIGMVGEKWLIPGVSGQFKQKTSTMANKRSSSSLQGARTRHACTCILYSSTFATTFRLPCYVWSLHLGNFKLGTERW